MFSFRALLIASYVFFTCGGTASAQGEDSTRYERDAQVISQLLPGVYDNYNQVYFDGRMGLPKAEIHKRREIGIKRLSGSRDSPQSVFKVTDKMTMNVDRYGNTAEQRRVFETGKVFVVFANNEEQGVQMDVYVDSGDDPIKAISEREADCSVLFVREASQFSSSPLGGCRNMSTEYVLSEKQLFVSRHPEQGDGLDTQVPYQLNRARLFQCYVDIPGVSGGRDEPYERYEGYTIHDQGGSFEITTRDADKRRFVITLSNIDWPINNHHDVFTRDVLVFYLSERTEEGVINLGYSFTEPTVKRMGMNLKWLLMSCWMESNKVTKPFL
ncbi:MAG: hypothetical protein AAF438_01435 [Pseudomonadota bacterium]